jgi:uncharacterized protein (DUF433 family)
MEHTITVSEQVYLALQRQATRRRKPLEVLAENWLKQHLDLEHHSDLEWRQGPGGWRVGIQDTAIDVHTIVGYSHLGYTPQEIADELLPRLSLEQVHAALEYYAEYPDEIDQILAESEPEATKARLHRTLGPTIYRHLIGVSEQSDVVQETRPPYNQDSESTGGGD